MSKVKKADKTTRDELETASVLAFERKLDPSDAELHSGLWDQRGKGEWAPISVREKSVRGTISNRLKGKDQDPAKLDAAIDNPNLQTVDVATLPAAADTLRCTFTVRVLPGVGVPSACNSVAYRAKLQEKVAEYAKASGYKELARRYVISLATGRFLWRNRNGAEQVEVHIGVLRQGSIQQSWTFDALRFSLRSFDVPAEYEASIKELQELIAGSFSGGSSILLQITAFARIGPGQEVYPSQELILDKENAGKSKTLYTVGDVAGLHSQKIGNALRTIDTWHGDEWVGPIAVEPYGAVTTLGQAFRRPTDKLDFYSLLDNWVLKDVAPPLEQQHFVVATLIRGGVFGEAGKD